ncbi:SDR family NAD(P)-dependent oxidoreductase [Couchioplanes caeruleus]|uniref:SDR family NAD(P)-dependent oxidoreductase n=1 Tax=Couchioplanes caeruleus TaxID=56438 RepID=UPI003D314D9A
MAGRLRRHDGALSGRTAVVTGGSRGIGRAIVERLARDGARVIFGYRSRDEEARAVEAALPAPRVSGRRRPWPIAGRRDPRATAGLRSRRAA